MPAPLKAGFWNFAIVLGAFVLPAKVEAKPKAVAKPAAVIDPAWDDRGIDTTQPEWYRKHPFWIHIRDPFKLQCDSIAARLRDSVPASPDTVVRYVRGKMEGHGDEVDGKGLIFQGRGLILRPQLLRSSAYRGTPVGWLRPEDGPWRVLSIYRPDGEVYPPKLDVSERVEAYHTIDGVPDRNLDRLTEPAKVLALKYPGYYALVASPTKKPLGWVPVDSIALFPDSSDANMTAPFYREGIAAFVHGAWKERSQKGGGDGEPRDAMMAMGRLHIHDMIHLWSIQLGAKDGLDYQHIPKYLKKCRISQRQDNGAVFVWLSAPCVDKADSIPMGYLYEKAEWVKFKRIRRVKVNGSATDKWYGFGLYDFPEVDLGSIITAAPGGVDEGFQRFRNVVTP